MDYIQIENFTNLNSIVDRLVEQAEVPHDEYGSVKLYCNSNFIELLLRHIIRYYPNISIASIDFVSSRIDSVPKDLYVLSITEDSELFIQPAYNGDTLYSNEAKYTLCHKDVGYEIIDNIYGETDSIVIFNSQK